MEVYSRQLAARLCSAPIRRIMEGWLDAGGSGRGGGGPGFPLDIKADAMQLEPEIGVGPLRFGDERV